MKDKIYDGFHRNMKQHNCVQHWWVICEGSCDPEDWSNDDKFSFDHRNKLHFTVYSHRQQMIYTGVIYCIFVSNICSFNEQKIYYCYGGVDQKIGRLQTFGLFKTTTISFILDSLCVRHGLI